MELRFSDSKKLFTSEQTRALEQEFCFAQGKTLLDLMEEAGTQIAAYINQNYQYFIDSEKQIIILSGPGNNGGDGFVTAKHLKELGFKVLLLLVKANKYSDCLMSQIEHAEQNNLEYKYITEDLSDAKNINLSDLDSILNEETLVIDCLLGTGQKGEPRGLIAKCIQKVMHSKNTNPGFIILSVDVPTGIDCDTGSVNTPCIFPDQTLIMQHFKLGMVQSPAIESLGVPVLLDIGLDDRGLQTNAEYELLTEAYIPARIRNCHKHEFGHVLVIAGNKNMPGAGLLAAAACQKSGAGLVTMLSSGVTYVNSNPEIMYQFTDNDLNNTARDLIGIIDKFDCILIGPGLGVGQEQTGFVYQLLREISARKIMSVLDADALSALNDLNAMSVPLSLPTVVITPHPGEAAKLLGVTSSEIQSNRYLSAENLSKKFNCSVVLKGASSVCYNPDASLKGKVNSSGGPFMATAGSGDVLAGMLAAFLAQGQKLPEASNNAVFLHGLAAEIAHSEHNGPIIASDIISKIPHAIGKYTN